MPRVLIVEVIDRARGLTEAPPHLQSSAAKPSGCVGIPQCRRRPPPRIQQDTAPEGRGEKEHIGKKLGLQEPELGKRADGFADDQMIEDSDVDERQRFFQTPHDELIGLARR